MFLSSGQHYFSSNLLVCPGTVHVFLWGGKGLWWWNNIAFRTAYGAGTELDVPSTSTVSKQYSSSATLFDPIEYTNRGDSSPLFERLRRLWVQFFSLFTAFASQAIEKTSVIAYLLTGDPIQWNGRLTEWRNEMTEYSAYSKIRNIRNILKHVI